MPHVKTDTTLLASVIQQFEQLLPGWWFSVSTCQVSRDASCGPTTEGPDAHLLRCRLFDAGFSVDLHEAGSQMAEALLWVMIDALEAREAARGKIPRECGEYECAKCPLRIE